MCGRFVGIRGVSGWFYGGSVGVLERRNLWFVVVSINGYDIFEYVKVLRDFLGSVRKGKSLILSIDKWVMWVNMKGF